MVMPKYSIHLNSLFVVRANRIYRCLMPFKRMYFLPMHIPDLQNEREVAGDQSRKKKEIDDNHSRHQIPLSACHLHK
jgi:hypothetical protein